jgi:hypothetical protein
LKQVILTVGSTLAGNKKEHQHERNRESFCLILVHQLLIDCLPKAGGGAGSPSKKNPRQQCCRGFSFIGDQYRPAWNPRQIS